MACLALGGSVTTLTCEGRMYLLSMAIGIAGGLLAMSSILVGRSAQAAEKLATLAKYQGWIGLTMFGWGIWELISCVLHFSMLGSHPLWFAFAALSGVADFAVGFLLACGLIATYGFQGNAVAIERGNFVRSKLVAYQVPLGGLAVATSAVYGGLHFV
jgi:hypothetical protein